MQHLETKQPAFMHPRDINDANQLILRKIAEVKDRIIVGFLPLSEVITRKSMPAHKLGRLWKFLASEVEQWVKGGLAAQEPTDVAVPKGAKRRSTKKLG